MLMRLHKPKNKGFTLPEVILIVAVMAILTTMAFPDIVSFFRRQKKEEEKQVQAEIRKAMTAYSNENLDLPPVATWNEDLALYTNLSAQGILNDVWGRPRMYAMLAQDKVYREGVVTFYYASVATNGEDNVFESGTWNDVDSYSTYQAVNDDIITKFTDQETKQKRYDETVTRMERIIAALDRYAQARYNNAVLCDPAIDPSCDVNYDKKIFYPRSVYDAPPAAGYGNFVESDLADFVGGPVENTVESMQSLMRMLGLPEDHCCSALAPAGAPQPFYYVANPVPETSVGGCGAPRTEPPFMPPKISLDPLPC